MNNEGGVGVLEVLFGAVATGVIALFGFLFRQVGINATVQTRLDVGEVAIKNLIEANDETTEVLVETTSSMAEYKNQINRIEELVRQLLEKDAVNEEYHRRVEEALLTLQPLLLRIKDINTEVIKNLFKN